MTNGTILYTGNFELPDKNAAAHRVMNNAKIFHALGYRTAFLGVVRNESFDGIRQSSFDEDIYEESYPESSKEWLRHIFDTKNIRALAEKYDDVRMVITYNAPYAAFKAVKRAFRNTAVKVAYDCTEWNSYADGSFLKQWYKKIDGFEIEHFLSKKCPDLIVISSMMERKYHRCNLLRIPPLVDLSDPVWHQKREEHRGFFEFCFAGEVSNNESLDKVVQAFCMIDDPALRLRIVGITKEDYIRLIPSHEAAVRSDDRIRFEGYVSHDLAVKYTLSCDCYIFVREKSKRNRAGFSTKFVEAYTCGVPIIMTGFDDIGRYIGSKDDGILLNDISVEAVKECMLEMAAHGKSTERKLREVFDYQSYVGETEKWVLRSHLQS